MTNLIISTPTEEIKLSKSNFKKEMKKNRNSEFYAYFNIMSNKYLAESKDAFKFLISLMTNKKDIKRAKDDFRRYNSGLNKQEKNKITANHKKYNSKSFLNQVSKLENELNRGGMYDMGKMRPENMLD